MEDQLLTEKPVVDGDLEANHACKVQAFRIMRIKHILFVAVD